MGSKPKRLASTALAKPGDPLVLPNGRTIKADRPTATPIDLRKSVDPATFKPLKKRNKNELPALPQMMNAVGVVFMYTMFGVGDREIADVLKTTVGEIEGIRATDAYAEMFETVLNVFISSNSDMLQSRVAAYSHDALSTVADLSQNSKNDKVKLDASVDLLDRAGMSPKEMQGKNQQAAGMSQLRIVIVEKRENANVSVDVDL